MRTNDHRAACWLTFGLLSSLALATGCSDSDSGGNCLGKGGCSPSEQCKTIATTPVAWTDQTVVGSPAELFSSLAGTCQAPFHWDGSGWGGAATIAPLQGQSTLAATVAVDPSSARLVTQTPEFCPSLLQADATVTLVLPEGAIATARPVTVSATAGAAPTKLGLVLNEAEFGPWVSIQKADPVSTLAMSISVTAVARGCSGNIILSLQRVEGNTGSATGGDFAAWSDSGCAVGQASAPLGQPWQGIDFSAAVAAAFGNAALPGTWTDGSATTLALNVAPAATAMCVETLLNGISVLIIPANVVASTADGRVQGLAAAGSIRANVSQGSLTDLQLVLSTDLVCASTTDTLAYAAANCATVAKVSATMIYNRYYSSATPASGSLELYVYNRQTATPGTADAVERLLLGP
jgi:hypothetical protein